MARLSGSNGESNWVMQQIGGMVVLSHAHTEDVLVEFDPASKAEVAKAMTEVQFSDKLNVDEKSMAHFWAGYFWAHASR